MTGKRITMAEDIRNSLLKLRYEEPTHFQNLVSSGIQKNRGFTSHLKALNIPCGDGPPLPRSS